MNSSMTSKKTAASKRASLPRIADYAKSFLKANPDVAGRIEATIRQNSGLVADRILDQADPTAEDLDEGEA